MIGAIKPYALSVETPEGRVSIAASGSGWEVERVTPVYRSRAWFASWDQATEYADHVALSAEYHSFDACLAREKARGWGGEE